jgi:hypothetical protein
MTPIATIDLDALAAELEREGWTRDLNLTVTNEDLHTLRHRGIWIRGITIRCMEFDDHDDGINLTDPLWQKALPILLRHVAGEGET